MIDEFKPIAEGITNQISEWEPKLLKLSNGIIAQKRNKQNRTIKQIVGHMIDSATNNTHRIVHLHYQSSPFTFPNYATNGNNDRWIAIQNYQDEDWFNLVQLWKYMNIHITHLINNIDKDKLKNEWIASPDNNVNLKAMVIDYLPHLELHLNEINEIINQ